MVYIERLYKVTEVTGVNGGVSRCRIGRDIRCPDALVMLTVLRAFFIFLFYGPIVC
jgi:hypothetical protein